MRTADFNYVLPPELIAQQPAPQRDQSRLLVLHRNSGEIAHKTFRDLLDYLRPGDVLVLNNSRVIPARLRGTNSKTAGQFEILLLEENSTNDWWVMLRPGKRAQIGTEIQITPRSSRRKEALTSKSGKRESGKAETTEPPHVGCYNIQATVTDTNDEGHRRLLFAGVDNILDALNGIGEVPLPPYIHRTSGAPVSDPARTVAAPTAGLHFTESLLDEIRSRGVKVCFVTLHVGLATFAPVKAENLGDHKMHEEHYEVSEATARAVSEAKAAGRRVIAVGTTTVRVLESAAIAFGVPPSGGSAGARMPSSAGGRSEVLRMRASALLPGSGGTRIFIHPPFQFQIVDALLTNFHLPCSTLLMLVSAFAAPGKVSGRETILSAYAEAIRERYRFFSYGDAMLIL